MPYPAGVIPWKIKEFTNVHQNYTQPLDEDLSFDMVLDDPAFQSLDQFSQYKKCTANFQWIIKYALDNQLNIRALGSGWSFSKVGMSEDAIINTKRLRHKFALGKDNFHPDFLNAGNKPENFKFLQCGNTIIQINEYLEKQCQPSKSLMVSGGSNGQTIAGAFSTGTHGASVFKGALPEMVVGMHVITGPDRHIYVERASRRITSVAFQQKLGAEVFIDDDLFHAIWVSFGSFGIIHGVLVEVEDNFLLEQKMQRVPFDSAMVEAVTKMDFSKIQHHLKYTWNDPLRHLYHFELAVNPHDFAFEDVEKGVFMRSMFKVAYRQEYTKIEHATSGFTYGDDTLGLIQSVLDEVQAKVGFLNRILVPQIVNSIFGLAYSRPEDLVGTIAETFTNTRFRGKAFSAAICLDVKDVVKALNICLKINEAVKLAGVLAFRFVKGNSATLAFTRFKHSVVMELDGADAAINHQYYQLVLESLEASAIPYTIHWGKLNRIVDKNRLNYIYGNEIIQQWKKQRSRVMTEEVQQLFNNEFMQQCGLDGYVP
ncbi:FAD-dependent oxidoreductase [Aquiflexum sp. TKW24L]|uniref:FAD-dependent oxidoreductase n=1 Tax=Aquiflexum sp. TKW24L TaxID=2942212 RepID=UPI0020BE0374|nr:FAD-dependent oxidoreductase [Aquiflexum sp. TKW24L]MCL6259412.1 FAD-dependent oxidoreductase [Aquiflexum sp. TKW24L]